MIARSYRLNIKDEITHDLLKSNYKADNVFLNYGLLHFIWISNRTILKFHDN